MNENIKKEGVRSSTLKITPEIKEQIQFFKGNLQYMYDHEECTSEFDAESIDIILNRLDDYDRNMLLAYYSISDCNVTRLSEILCMSKSSVSRRINLIIDKIKKMNNVKRTTYNKPRVDICY